jgi:hemolysin-activating ACP:hemolysin acyltransferase
MCEIFAQVFAPHACNPDNTHAIPGESCKGCSRNCGAFLQRPKRRHSMTDWMELHRGTGERFDPRDVANLVERAMVAVDRPREQASMEPLSPQEALTMVVSAMRNAFPTRRQIIDRVARTAVFDFDPMPGASVTLDRGEGQAPLVKCPFKGSAADLMTLAHEFGHAVQLVASQGRFVPPALREVCAFLAELFLLDDLGRQGSPHHAAATAVWRRGDARFLGVDSRSLIAALGDGDRAYTYRYNYPLGRIVAHRARAWLPEALLWDLFAGRTTLAPFIEGIQAKDESSLAPASFTDLRAADQLRRYRQIGMFVASECKQGGSAAEAPMDVCLDLAMSWMAERPGTDPISPAAGQVDRFAAAGMALALFASSPLHRKFRPARYFPVHVMPALKLGQARVYLDLDGQATAFITWAWLSDAVEAEFLSSGRAPTQEDWTSGNRAFVHDWVALPRGTHVVVRDLKYGLFRDHVVTGIRRRSDGSVRKIGRWIGANVPRIGPDRIQAAACAQAGLALEA